jgi:hypothetical protein
MGCSAFLTATHVPREGGGARRVRLRTPATTLQQLPTGRRAVAIYENLDRPGGKAFTDKVLGQNVSANGPRKAFRASRSLASIEDCMAVWFGKIQDGYEVGHFKNVDDFVAAKAPSFNKTQSTPISRPQTIQQDSLRINRIQ